MSGKIGKDANKEQEGVIPRIIDDLFHEMSCVTTPTEFSLGVGFVPPPKFQIRFVEIYMERIRDLLDLNATNLKIHVSPYFPILVLLLSRNRGVFLEGRSSYISSKDEFYAIWNKGTQNRCVGQTKMNSVGFFDI